MVLVGIWILVFLATTSFVLLKKKYKLFDVNDGHAVYCHYRYQSSSIASAQACNSPSNAIFELVVVSKMYFHNMSPFFKQFDL